MFHNIDSDIPIKSKFMRQKSPTVQTGHKYAFDKYTYDYCFVGNEATGQQTKHIAISQIVLNVNITHSISVAILL